MSKNYHVVPWYNSNEWDTVYKNIFSENASSNSKHEALRYLKVWKARCPSLPSGIESTLTLLDVCLQDSDSTTVSEEILRLAYSTAVMRFTNHMLDSQIAKGQSLYNAAKDLGIPVWIIDLRHDTAHGHNLPALNLLREASVICLQWLDDNYWKKQKSCITDFITGQEIIEIDEFESKQAIESFGNLYCAFSMLTASSINKIKNIEDENMKTSIINEAVELFGKYTNLSDIKNMPVDKILKIFHRNFKKIFEHPCSAQYLYNVLLGKESLILSTELLKHAGVKNVNNCNKLKPNYVQNFELLLTFLHGQDLILDFIMELIKITESEENNKNRRKLAALWVSEILKSLLNTKQFASSMSKSEDDSLTERPKDSLRQLFKHHFPAASSSLLLDCSHPVPKELKDINFVQPIISAYNPYLIYFVKDLLNLVTPTLSSSTIDKISTLAHVISSPKEFSTSVDSKVYTVDDIMDDDDEPAIVAEVTKDNDCIQVENENEQEDCIENTLWKLATAEFDWSAIPLGYFFGLNINNISIDGKFLAFIGPVDYKISLYHPPQMYLDYFKSNNVKLVIRLNKRMYDASLFTMNGIEHHDLYFPDGSCPPRHILFRFLQLAEETAGAVAVHCKAGLGRTGSLIGSYLIKHYRMTAREAIGWMRICRPGSVIGHQQGWLEQLEPWLLKQGNVYRKRTYCDTEAFPVHEFGIYSIAEKTAAKQRPLVLSRLPSPTSKTSDPKSNASDKEDKTEEEEKFLASCDLTKEPSSLLEQVKGLILYLRNPNVVETPPPITEERTPRWKRCLFCKPCTSCLGNVCFYLAVRCARISSKRCQTSACCICLDKQWGIYKQQPHQQNLLTKSRVAAHKGTPASSKTSKNKGWIVRPSAARPSSRQCNQQAPPHTAGTRIVRTTVAAGEPRTARSPTSRNTEIYSRNISPGYQHPSCTYHKPHNDLIRTIHDAKNALMKSTTSYTNDRHRQSNSPAKVVPPCSSRVQCNENRLSDYSSSTIASTPVARVSNHNRRRLGRSPSPQARAVFDQNRATNTPHPPTTFVQPSKKKSIPALREALSTIKTPLSRDRDGSIGAASVGAASLGAQREAPAGKRTSSVRSDDRPLATQGDMLNSIKFARRHRQLIPPDNFSSMIQNRASSNAKESSRSVSPTHTNISRKGFNTEPGSQRDKLPSNCKVFNIQYSSARPSSPKGRKNSHTFY